MVDKPGRPDGDGLREMNERAKRHAVRWGASAGCFDMLVEFARCEIERATQPASDGAEGAEDFGDMPSAYGEVLDEMDHQAKYQSATADPRREQELRIQALGAAISRRDWHAAEQAYNAIRDKFNNTMERSA